MTSKGEHIRVYSGEVINNQYEVVEEIGCGNFSKVYKVYDMKNPNYPAHKKRTVLALKIVKKEYEGDAYYEKKMLAILCAHEHELIESDGGTWKDKSGTSKAGEVCLHRFCRMIEYFEYKNCPVFVMPMYGPSLRSLKLGIGRGISFASHSFNGGNGNNSNIMNRFILTRSVFLEFALELMETLHYTHMNCKIVHTDLKPENILIADPLYEKKMQLLLQQKNALIRRNNGGGSASTSNMSNNNNNNNNTNNNINNNNVHYFGNHWVICDFGSASTWSNYRKDKDLISTRPYRAPEVILGKEWYYPADMWSAGCILYEVAVGRRLFDNHYHQNVFTGGSSNQRCNADLIHLCLMKKKLEHEFPEGLVRDSKLGSRFFSRTGELLFDLSDRPNDLDASNSNILVSRSRIYTLREVFQHDADLYNLLDYILEFDPEMRPTAEQVMELPIFDAVKEKRRLERDLQRKIIAKSMGNTSRKNSNPVKQLDAKSLETLDTMENTLDLTLSSDPNVSYSLLNNPQYSPLFNASIASTSVVLDTAYHHKSSKGDKDTNTAPTVLADGIADDNDGKPPAFPSATAAAVPVPPAPPKAPENDRDNNNTFGYETTTDYPKRDVGPNHGSEVEPAKSGTFDSRTTSTTFTEGSYDFSSAKHASLPLPTTVPATVMAPRKEAPPLSSTETQRRSESTGRMIKRKGGTFKPSYQTVSEPESVGSTLKLDVAHELTAGNGSAARAKSQPVRVLSSTTTGVGNAGKAKKSQGSITLTSAEGGAKNAGTTQPVLQKVEEKQNESNEETDVISNEVLNDEYGSPRETTYPAPTRHRKRTGLANINGPGGSGNTSKSNNTSAFLPVNGSQSGYTSVDHSPENKSLRSNRSLDVNNSSKRDDNQRDIAENNKTSAIGRPNDTQGTNNNKNNSSNNNNNNNNTERMAFTPLLPKVGKDSHNAQAADENNSNDDLISSSIPTNPAAIGTKENAIKKRPDSGPYRVVKRNVGSANKDAYSTPVSTNALTNSATTTNNNSNNNNNNNNNNNHNFANVKLSPIDSNTAAAAATDSNNNNNNNEVTTPRSLPPVKVASPLTPGTNAMSPPYLRHSKDEGSVTRKSLEVDRAANSVTSLIEGFNNNELNASASNRTNAATITNTTAAPRFKRPSTGITHATHPNSDNANNNNKNCDSLITRSLPDAKLQSMTNEGDSNTGGGEAARSVSEEERARAFNKFLMKQNNGNVSAAANNLDSAANPSSVSANSSCNRVTAAPTLTKRSPTKHDSGDAKRISNADNNNNNNLATNTDNGRRANASLSGGAAVDSVKPRTDNNAPGSVKQDADTSKAKPVFASKRSSVNPSTTENNNNNNNDDDADAAKSKVRPGRMNVALCEESLSDIVQTSAKSRTPAATTIAAAANPNNNNNNNTTTAPAGIASNRRVSRVAPMGASDVSNPPKTMDEKDDNNNNQFKARNTLLTANNAKRASSAANNRVAPLTSNNSNGSPDDNHNDNNSPRIAPSKTRRVVVPTSGEITSDTVKLNTENAALEGKKEESEVAKRRRIAASKANSISPKSTENTTNTTNNTNNNLGSPPAPTNKPSSMNANTNTQANTLSNSSANNNTGVRSNEQAKEKDTANQQPDAYKPSSAAVPQGANEKKVKSSPLTNFGAKKPIHPTGNEENGHQTYISNNQQNTTPNNTIHNSNNNIENNVSNKVTSTPMVSTRPNTAAPTVLRNPTTAAAAGGAGTSGDEHSASLMNHSRVSKAAPPLMFGVKKPVRNMSVDLTNSNTNTNNNNNNNNNVIIASHPPVVRRKFNDNNDSNGVTVKTNPNAVKNE